MKIIFRFFGIAFDWRPIWANVLPNCISWTIEYSAYIDKYRLVGHGMLANRTQMYVDAINVLNELHRTGKAGSFAVK